MAFEDITRSMPLLTTNLEDGFSVVLQRVLQLITEIERLSLENSLLAAEANERGRS